MEIMIAIGILGVGAVMVASLFPAAIREANEAYTNGYGEMICATGLGIAKAIDQNPYDSFTDGDFEVLPGPGTYPTHYPTSYDPDETDYHFMILRLDLTVSSGDYIYYVIVAYRGDPSDVQLAKITVDPNDVERRDTSTILRVINGAQYLRLGSPILFKNGLGGIIKAVNVDGDSQRIQINRVIPEDIPLPTGNHNARTVYSTADSEVSPVLLYHYYLAD